MITGIFAVILLAMVMLGWAFDRRAATRREQDAMTDGIWVGKLIGIIPQEQKDQMFADVMASHHERNGYVEEKKWNRYTVGMLAFAATCMALSALIWMSM